MSERPGKRRWVDAPEAAYQTGDAREGDVSRERLHIYYKACLSS